MFVNDRQVDRQTDITVYRPAPPYVAGHNKRTLKEDNTGTTSET